METREARGGVLVLGGGFAGAYVARLLGVRGATIVSPENFMLFTPLLPEAASGTLEPRHCVVPLRAMCPHTDLLLGRVTSVDLAAQTTQVETDEGPQDVAWRELVIALGAVPRVVSVPGLTEHGLSFKSLADAIHLRNHVLRELEAADAAADETERRRHLSFVFVGAGYAGVEALAELADLVGTLPVSTRGWPAFHAGGCSSTRRPRSCRRFLRGSESTRPRSSRTAASRSTSPRCSSPSRRTRWRSATGSGFRRTRSSGRPESPRTRYCARSVCRSTSAAASKWTSYCASVGTSTSGRSATTRESRTASATIRIRRRANMHSARRRASRRTPPATAR